MTQARALLSAGRKPEALLALHRLAAESHGEALRILGELSWGRQVDPDPVAGRALFDRAAQAGDPVAAIYATNLLASGIAGPRDWPRAIERLRGEAERDPARRKALAAIGADGARRCR